MLGFENLKQGVPAGQTRENLRSALLLFKGALGLENLKTMRPCGANQADLRSALLLFKSGLGREQLQNKRFHSPLGSFLKPSACDYTGSSKRALEPKRGNK